MAISEIFILYGTKDNEIFYVANTDPIIWTPDIRQSKPFYNRYTAEYSILREYNNYRIVADMIEHNTLDEFYIAILQNGIEVGRSKLL